MVWIYGGGFSAGATASPVYDGARLAGKGVIVVSVAYRLGALGFMAHPERCRPRKRPWLGQLRGLETRSPA